MKTYDVHHLLWMEDHPLVRLLWLLLVVSIWVLGMALSLY